jgi:cobalt-zinc-cadmium efflux system membrane fusion protein
MHMATKFLKGAWLLLLLSACGTAEDPAAEHLHDELPENQVRLTEAQLAQFDWQLDTVQERRLGQRIQLNGMIDVPPQNRSLLHPPVAAYVQDLRVKVGQLVRKGEVLAVLEHPEILEIQRRYLDAKAQLQFLERDFARQEELARDQATAAKQLDKARADLSSAQALTAALKAQVQRLGINANELRAEQLRTNLQLLAPYAGYVTAVEAQLGQFVGADRPLIGMLNKAHLHVELELFERDLAAVKNGQRIEFELTNVPGKKFTGDVFLIGQTLDPDKRTVMVHGHIDQEEDPLLRPGLFVTAQLLQASEAQPALPETALIRSGDQMVAFKYLSPGLFERVLLTTGAVQQGYIALQTRPEAGSRWVSTGAYRLEAAWQARFASEEEGH